MADFTPHSTPNSLAASISPPDANPTPDVHPVATPHIQTAPRRPRAHIAKLRLRQAIRNRRRRRRVLLATGLAWPTPPSPQPIAIPSPAPRGTKRGAEALSDDGTGDTTDSEVVQMRSSPSMLFAFTPPSSPPVPKRLRVPISLSDSSPEAGSPTGHREWRRRRFEQRRRAMDDGVGRVLRRHHGQPRASGASVAAVTPTAAEAGRRELPEERPPWTYRVYLPPVPKALVDALWDVLQTAGDGGSCAPPLALARGEEDGRTAVRLAASAERVAWEGGGMNEEVDTSQGVGWNWSLDGGWK
ncbi:alpha-catulin [Gracilaria domingensis]|nr:alpha-catulin [Gracilaria domingensis]